MKLYTEEQVREAIHLGHCNTIDEVLDQLTPIELPSDEEIEKAVIKTYPNSCEYQRTIGFKKGAKWLKEQILNQNK